VIISAPSSDAPTIVCGANFETFKPSMQVISAGSCTGMVLAPFLKLVSETFGLEECSFVSIHSSTPQQRVVDGANTKEWRAARSVLNNIIPHTTGALKTVQKSLPNLAQRVLGSELRVPVQNGCALDVTVRVSQATTRDGFTSAIMQAAEERYANSIAYSNEELVSSDICGRSGALIFDAKATQSLNKFTHKLLFWYDNELGYAMRLIDLVVDTNATW
jgi:glyceraldehyde 3-phosphate dehydrogenase